MPETAVVVGTFGCMTGTYLCVSCVNPDEDIKVIHKNIIGILADIDKDNLAENHREQLEKILQNYQEFGRKN